MFKLPKTTKWITFTLFFIMTFATEITAKPTYDIYNDDYSDYAPRRSTEQSSHILSSLKRGYYYIDNGSIVPVRRSDDPDTGYSHYSYYTPIVHYRKQHTEHKKLFVPNFFG
ncbi:uncharacterized protein LOC133334784 [Musca vetustissima]|uniref:uncharacterized protein LOC133334784 n=1 Tax=Musca vetustissima TaxID=27455 RepID=UPI002AB63900|nr:uncharacterized protein LOC133334784 [Musca vetustissima]